MMKTVKQPVKKTRRIRSHIVSVVKCKYCGRKVYNHAAFKRHVRNHERKYRRHWSKKKPRAISASAMTMDHTTDTHKEHSTKAKFTVYIVYAPKPSCTCQNGNQVQNMACNCSFTYKRLIYSSVAQMHHNLQNNVRSYKCSSCKEQVAQRSSEHGPDSVYQCSHCGDRFTTESNLKTHQMTCLQCKSQHKTHKEMVHHTSSVHIKNDRTVQNECRINICPVCGLNNASMEDLKGHLETHPGSMKTTLQVCCVCGYTTNDALQLALHGKLHMNSSVNKTHVESQTTQQTEVLSQSRSGMVQSGSGMVQSGSGAKLQSLYKSKSHVRDESECRIRSVKSSINPGSRAKCETRHFASRTQSKSLTMLKMKQSTSKISAAKILGTSAPIKNNALIGVRSTNIVKGAPSVSSRLRPRKQTKPSMYIDNDEEAPSVPSRLRPRKQTKPSMYIDNDEEEEDITESTRLYPHLPHACNFCERAFVSMGYLNTHKQKVHCGSKPYLCLVCKRRFMDKTLFDLHGEMHKETFKCSNCPKSFKKLELLRNHDEVHRKSQFATFKCLDCNEVHHNPKSLYEHMQSHRKEVTPQIQTNADQSKSVRFKCSLGPLCERSFTSKFALRIHEKSVHKLEDKIFQCKFCEKQFKFETDHKIHESLHREYSGPTTSMKTPSYKCKFCGKRLRYLSDLKQHEALHEQVQKKYPCDKCNRVFMHRQEMMQHRRHHKRDKLPKPTKCPDCDKTFVYGSELRDHKKTHWSEKPFVCVYCKQRFTTQQEVTEHEPQHTKDKRHKCDICGRRFRDKRHIRDHMLIHSGEKPFPCSFCGKRFRQASHLQTHERVHTREAPFVCDICNRAFIFWTSLRVHLKSHYKDKSPEEVEEILKKTRIVAKKKETDTSIKERKKKQRGVSSTRRAPVESHKQQVSTIVSTQTLQQQQSEQSSAPNAPHELPSAPLHQHVQQNVNLPPIPLTISSTTDQIQLEHMSLQLQRRPGELHQQQQQPVMTDTPWETLHARYMNNPPHHPGGTTQHETQQTWQQAANWQSGGANWEMGVPGGHWSATGPAPPTAHQGHASSILTSTLFGIIQRENDARGFQQ